MQSQIDQIEIKLDTLNKEVIKGREDNNKRLDEFKSDLSEVVLALKGNEHLGIEGHGKRIVKLENFMSKLFKIGAIVSGVFMVFGAFVGGVLEKVYKLFDKLFH